MKEKIGRFARGEFRYHKPELTASVTDISISLEAGRVYEGSFSVRAGGKSSMRGTAYPKSGLMCVTSPDFEGNEVSIAYRFDASGLDANDIIKGSVSVVTDCGELSIPYICKVKQPACDTSIGPISDLFHFANLAQSNWAEAKQLFRSDDFLRIIRYYDRKYLTLYTRLRDSKNLSLGLEEFLIGVRKKRPIVFSADKSELVYENVSDDFTDVINIRKEGWGYAQLGVSSDVDFIEPDRNIIWSDDFAGSNVPLTLIVHADRLRAGKSFGNIILKSATGELAIPVSVIKNSKNAKDMAEKRRLKECRISVMKRYISMRLGEITPGRFASETDKLLPLLKSVSSSELFESVVRAGLLYISGKEMAARNILKEITSDESWQEAPDDIYCAILYLLASLTKDARQQSDYIEQLKTAAGKQGDFMSLWFLLQVDKRYKVSRSLRFEALRDQYDKGANSPLLYLEALLTAEEEPSVIHEMTGFELHMLNFGIRNKRLDRATLLQAAYAAGKVRDHREQILRCLYGCYTLQPEAEVLKAIAGLIIELDCRTPLAYSYLKEAASSQMRINGLYEQCVRIPEGYAGEPLPKPVYTYYLAGMELPDEFAATLYANLIKFKNDNPVAYRTLMPGMSAFAAKKLAEGAISEPLALIYNKILDTTVLDDALVLSLPEILFKHVIDLSGIKNLPDGRLSVCTVHSQLRSPVITEVVDNKAFVDIFTEDYEIFLLDEAGNSFYSYDLRPVRLILRSDLQDLCLEKQVDDGRLLINQATFSKFEDMPDEHISVIRRLAETEVLSPDYYMECQKELIEYYYENLEGELLESHLLKVNPENLPRKERIRLFEFMIMRELYNLAFKNMEIYGYYGCDTKKLLKMVQKLLVSGAAENHMSLLEEICAYTFRQGKYNMQSLEFLQKHFVGSPEEMHELWKVASGVGIECTDLEERLLGTLLFIESDMSYSREVFKHYYSHGDNRVLIRAFLGYFAYEYLLNDRLLEPEILSIMRREANYEENDVCMLAYLRNLTETGYLPDADKSFVEYQLRRLFKKGLVLPFFRKFMGKVRVPGEMYDKYYIEYHSDPHYRVKVHYCRENSDSFIVEDMQNICYGIFIKECILFNGERLQYYISEECESGGTIITESGEISLETDPMGQVENDYHRLNLIITARELHDETTVCKLLENYVRNEYLGNRLFGPIED